MTLFAIAGGPAGGADLLECFGAFPILPLVLLLAVLAAYRNSIWLAGCALLLAGFPYLLLRQGVGEYRPSDDAEVRLDQEAGRHALAFYTWLIGIAGLGIAAVAVRRVKGRLSSAASPPSGQAPSSSRGPE